MSEVQTIESPTDFMGRYAAAINTHDFSCVAPMVSPDAVFVATDGETFSGHAAIRRMFEDTWKYIQDEDYIVNNVEVVTDRDNIVVFTYTFSWTGMVDDRLDHGRGHGRSTIVRRDGAWVLTHVRLAPCSAG